MDAQPDAAFPVGGDPLQTLLDAPEPLRTWAREARAFAWVPSLGAVEHPLGVRAARGIPGRKQAQIGAFMGAVLGEARGRPAPDHVLDWCAGKAHLGRALAAALDRPLVAVERDRALCEAGSAAAEAAGRAAKFHCVDALTPAAREVLGPGCLAVALHACGDLHAALLRGAIARGVEALAVAPCCYNRAAPEDVVLSQAGRAVAPPLAEEDLDLIHREVLVPGPAGRARLAQTLAWRLGVDLWLREVTKEDAYRPMPHFPDAWLTLGFGEFARRLAAAGGLPLSPGPEIDAYEAAGAVRLRAVVRRDAVRGLFARPLETFLWADRCALLAEAGYGARVGIFCARDVTPRNGLLLAHRG